MMLIALLQAVRLCVSLSVWISLYLSLCTVDHLRRRGRHVALKTKHFHLVIYLAYTVSIGRYKR